MSAVNPTPSADAASRHADADGYYGRPIVRAHIWTDEIGWYFFTGGLAGAASVLALAADASGRPRLARHARRASMLGLLPSPVLLIADLGRPSRFYNMLRVFKPTSPMSVGSWLLGVYAPAAVGAAALGELGALPRLRRPLGVVAGVAGAAVATYTAVLVADTATPAWYEARRELPYLFAASATASGAAATNVVAAVSGPVSTIATDLAAVGALTEIGVAKLMQHRLGDLDTYAADPAARRFDRLATALSVGGAVLSMVGRGRRWVTLASSLAIAFGSVCTRFAVLRAGTASARDPRSVLRQQRSDREAVTS